MRARPNLKTAETLPLVQGHSLDSPFLLGAGGWITLADFLGEVNRIAECLPDTLHVLNLCSERRHFLAAFCAIALRGQINLLPASRAPECLAELALAYGPASAVSDCEIRLAGVEVLDCRALGPSAPADHIPELATDQTVAIGFTSGSTGKPKPNAKTWGSLHASTQANAEVALGGRTAGACVVATVPAQHMYGLETTVLLPLLAGARLLEGRPFFPADVAAALARVPAPRILITTPVHLRSLLADSVDYPAVAQIVCATAPLEAELAAAAEARFHAELVEMFGSTETCVIAHRRTAQQRHWQLYPGISLEQSDCATRVCAAHLPTLVELQDVLDLDCTQRSFSVRGRNSDLLEIAGKRASLAEITSRLLQLDGVEDAVVLQPPCDGSGCIRRLAALVVAPSLGEREILEHLQRYVDPVFLPRPLRRVEALPRNETGKLARAEIERMLGL